MRDNWLWDKKITDSAAKRILRKPAAKSFLAMAALLLARKNEPKEVLRNYLDPMVFCQHWASIKRQMRRDKWSEPRIVFWQAIYERLRDKYREKGIGFKQKRPAKTPFCEAIGKKIAGVRKELGLSQKELAEKIGISQQLISRIEKGGENISLITLTNIAAGLNKEVNIDLITNASVSG